MDIGETSKRLAANLRARIESAKQANAQRAAQTHAIKMTKARIVHDAYEKELLREDIKAARAQARDEVRERMKQKEERFSLLGGGKGNSRPAFTIGRGGGFSGGKRRKNLLHV